MDDMTNLLAGLGRHGNLGSFGHVGGHRHAVGIGPGLPRFQIATQEQLFSNISGPPFQCTPLKYRLNGKSFAWQNKKSSERKASGSHGVRRPMREQDDQSFGHSRLRQTHNG